MLRHRKLTLANSAAAWALLCGFAAVAPASGQGAPGELAPTAERKLVPPQAGASEQRIAAIVNDEVISYFDLDQRMKLVISSSGYTPSEAEKRQLER
jgi:peptidyl-prolyl cis-trans isomerase SurA